MLIRTVVDPQRRGGGFLCFLEPASEFAAMGALSFRDGRAVWVQQFPVGLSDLERQFFPLGFDLEGLELLDPLDAAHASVGMQRRNPERTAPVPRLGADEGPSQEPRRGCRESRAQDRYRGSSVPALGVHERLVQRRERSPVLFHLGEVEALDASGLIRAVSLERGSNSIDREDLERGPIPNAHDSGVLREPARGRYLHRPEELLQLVSVKNSGGGAQSWREPSLLDVADGDSTPLDPDDLRVWHPVRLEAGTYSDPSSPQAWSRRPIPREPHIPGGPWGRGRLEPLENIGKGHVEDPRPRDGRPATQTHQIPRHVDLKDGEWLSSEVDDCADSQPSWTGRWHVSSTPTGVT